MYFSVVAKDHCSCTEAMVLWLFTDLTNCSLLRRKPNGSCLHSSCLRGKKFVKKGIVAQSHTPCLISVRRPSVLMSNGRIRFVPVSSIYWFEWGDVNFQAERGCNHEYFITSFIPRGMQLNNNITSFATHRIQSHFVGKNSLWGTKIGPHSFHWCSSHCCLRFLIPPFLSWWDQISLPPFENKYAWST